MKTYIIRVRVGATFAEVPIMAESYGKAHNQAEALYGQGSVLGLIETL